MPFRSTGDKLGPYEILSAIGAGGMGEVYKARDTRLDRTVAIKISNEEFTDRFEREARSIAALNHPNICHLYDVGPDYLVMEYIEGTPLKGPLPVDQALKCAVQICEALDAAHKKGITHRDLKPANILVTKAGIKLLDFGLAKIGGTAKPAGEATVTMAITGKNEIVGTLYYMSPEQLQAQTNGQEVDGRSDIFSFGLVLYEMLTGKRVFEGSSPASVIAAILERPAPSVASVAPAALDRVLQRCLAKDPEDRWQTVRDLKAELDWIASGRGEMVDAVRRQPRPPLPWIVAGVLAAAAVVLGIAYSRVAARPGELKPLVRFNVDLGPDVNLSPLSDFGAIVSADGSRIAYVSQGKLFTRRLDQVKAVELPQTEGARFPFFSPDGLWIAFFAQNKLKKISAEGGVAVALCDSPAPGGGSWGEDGNLIVALRGGAPLSRIPATGGTPVDATSLAPGEAAQRWPQILPGGRAVLFSSNSSMSGWNSASIDILNLTDRRRKTLRRGGAFARYVAASNDGPGHLIYVNRGTLFALAFDPATFETHGEPMRILEQIAYSAVQGYAQLDLSKAGMLLYRTGPASNSLMSGQWMETGGRVEPLKFQPAPYVRPSVSPDGERVALEHRGDAANQDIWIYEWKRDTMRRLTFDAGSKGLAQIWSRDGRYLVFNGMSGLYWVRSDGAGNPQRLTHSENVHIPGSFSPDGRLAFMEVEAGGNQAVWTLPLEIVDGWPRAGKPEVFLKNSFNNGSPKFSPDGRWIAYSSNESGDSQIYVRAYPDRGAKWQISSKGGARPIWSRNGRELFFTSGDGRINVVSYAVKGDSLLADQPKVWSEWRSTDASSTFDLTPDGKRIFALVPANAADAQQDQHHLVLLLNFADELQRKVPGGEVASLAQRRRNPSLRAPLNCVGWIPSALSATLP